MLKCRRGNFFLAFASALVLTFCVTFTATAETKMSAKDLVNKNCTRCHTLSNINKKQNQSVDEWIGTINRMKSAGLVISQQDQQTIAEYLSKTIKK